ncbi:MAG: phosphatase PAP2 family protein [Deltaproteobacteria bacterium]|nr:phosphatase PAP2 family protein [Deltaproteobacteria bacterium]
MSLRRGLGLYLLAVVVLCELATLLLLLGLPLPVTPGVVGILLAGPGLALALLWRRLGHPLEGGPGGGWALAGVINVLCWGSSYFVLGALIPESRHHTLPDPVLSWLPVTPAFSVIYVAVHPFNALPWFLHPSAAALKRLALAMGLMLGVSVAVWLAWPVATIRVLPPEGAGDLGSWVLGQVYATDPAANCLPSAHCALATCGALSLRGTHRGLGLWAGITCAIICLSTLFTHQHYLLDVLSGVGLGIGAWWAAGRLPAR